jgi:hypothetical protein
MRGFEILAVNCDSGDWLVTKPPGIVVAVSRQTEKMWKLTCWIERVEHGPFMGLELSAFFDDKGVLHESNLLSTVIGTPLNCKRYHFKMLVLK